MKMTNVVVDVWRQKALELAKQAALQAGEAALRYFHGGANVSIKPDGSPVTQADREAEEIIIAALRKGTQECGFLGEESGEEGSKEKRWIIDPIDGTKNFIRGIPVWAVLIALEEKGEITAGVVHNPATGELWTAAKGQGAQKNGERISVSTVGTLAEAQLLHSGLNALRKSKCWDGFVRLVDSTRRQRGPGDYLGYTMVAEGWGEIYLEKGLKPWDTAANQIIVREAGGVFTDMDGNLTIYSGSALATNGKLHKQILEILNGGNLTLNPSP